ncbi:MAG: carboxy terminal-processing peptidase [Flavobacteriales bacterium]
MRILKKNFKVLLLTVFVAAASCSFTTKDFNDTDRDKVLIDLISYVIEKGHYDPAVIDDEFSEHIFDNFLKRLDPLKRYFLESDIKEFSNYKFEIDDQIKNKDISFFNFVYQRFTKRLEESEKTYPEVLSHPFDYIKNETLNVDYEKIPFVSSKKKLKERWRKQLKLSALSNYYDLIEDNGKTKNVDSLSSTEQPTPPKSKEELEAKARETLKTTLDEYFEFTDELDREDYFAIFLTTITEEFDPHTNYFAPPDRDRFDQRMSGKLEGIGARLQKKNGYIKVVELISGGPAWRAEELEVGDIILKVKQEDEEEATSIESMRIDDAIKLIKGPKGTKVYLTLKRVDGSIDEIVITRDVVELEETYAKSTLINKEDKNFGLINLPQFYFDMNDYNKRNAASDIKKEIINLKKQGIQGLILDLRNNGGGSLRTAVDIGGLFIKDGPMVQIASKGSRKEVLKDEDDEVVWDGPLVILVNELSASASEILAAAMQDYKRAIIVGSAQTHGKGTVQNVLDLNLWLRKNDFGDVGALKMTTQKFYRVNGGSTQLEGVKSDVVMPDRYSYIEVGERDYDNALPYDKIDPANYKVWEGYIDYNTTIKNSKERIANNKQLQLIDENAKWIKSKQDKTVVALNYQNYKAEVEKRKAETKKFKEINKYDNHLNFASLPYEVALMKQDTTLQEKRKRWHKNLVKDIYVEEAVNVLEDLKLNNIRNNKVVGVKN